MANSITLKEKEKNGRLALVLLSYSAPVAIFTCRFYLACRVALAWRNDGGTIFWLTILVEELIGGILCVGPLDVTMLKELPIPRTLLQLSIFWIARKADGDRLPQTIREEEWPTVDVFVTYCGESLDTIMNTVKAACNLDYPQQLIRIIVLDDSASSKLAEEVDLFGREYCNLFYASRKVRVTTHSKAANLNFGLHFVQSLTSFQYV